MLEGILIGLPTALSVHTPWLVIVACPIVTFS